MDEEQAGDSVLDAVPDGVVVADADGRVLAINDVAAGMLGVDRRTATGRALAEVLLLRDQGGEPFLQVCAPYSSLSMVKGFPEHSWFLPDGREILVTGRLTRDTVGRVSRAGFSLRCGRGRERLDRERSDLVATVAHELRSPLTGVKGFVQAMLNRWDKLSDEQKRLMLATVNADSDRLSRLITELLDVARIDTGRLSLFPLPSDVMTLVDRAVGPLATTTSRKILIQAEDRPEVILDPDKFIQVLTNLLQNALRHGEGTVTVTVSTERGGRDPYLALVVSDEGGGIDPEIRGRVFTKFWTQGKRGGSGLGMYIVGGLVRAHGGEVEIADEPNGGARIVTRWPLRPA